MKKRIAKKRDKQLTSLALLCERIASNVIGKVSDALRLQSDLDEYRRFIGDLLIMLVKKEPQCVIQHSVPRDDMIGWIWDEVHNLIKENKELAQKLQDIDKTTDPQ